MTLIIGHLIGIYVNLAARFNRLRLQRGHCICGKLLYVRKGEELPVCPVHGAIPLKTPSYQSKNP